MLSSVRSRSSDSVSCRPIGSRYATVIMDLNQIPSSTHGHDFHSGLSKVVMVRKTEQRTFASTRSGEEPKFETVTRETVETFSGNRSQRVTTSEKRDVFKDLSDKFLDSLKEPHSNGSNSPKLATPSKSVNGTKPRDPSESPDRSVKLKSRSKGSLLKPRSRMDSDNSGADADFAAESLKAHNEYRVKHGVEPLKLSKKICKYSEEWAKHLASRGQMEHRQNSDYGENIFCSWSSNPNYTVTGREPVENWYSEIKTHPFGREPGNLKSGHFSQVVWRDSKELGVAAAKSRNGQIFVVANYSPPGNFIGSFAENVPPLGTVPKSDAKEGKSDTTDSVSKAKVGPSAVSEGEDFEAEGLKLHNDYRRKHGVSALRLNKSMCKYAEEWAKTLAKEDRFGHRPDCKYGENIFCLWSSDNSQPAKVIVKDACVSWYNEIKDHIFGVEPRLLKSGHFSQIVWKNSQELGIGMAKSKNGRTIVVANYEPRGNYVGQFAVNVPKLIKH